jgi:ATP-dependent DNA helicase RecG
MMTVFGDLDVSAITELPVGRKNIVTKIVDPANRPKAYGFIKQQVARGRQVFVICPRIDPSEKNPAQANQLFEEWEVKSVKEEYEKLSKKVYPDLRVEMLHGQMKPKEKEKVMRDFKDNVIQILVSTSVIEVGVDIPNATIMLIEGADRFGLAQLYQFRGRVGRGTHQSFCFLFTESPAKSTRERLEAVVRAKNGLELAEADLKLRGPGEFLGERQTGLPDIAMRGIQDMEMIRQSRDAAISVMKSDPALSNNPVLKKRFLEFERKVHKE